MAFKLVVDNVDRSEEVANVEYHGAHNERARLTFETEPGGWEPVLLDEVYYYKQDETTPTFGGLIFSRRCVGLSKNSAAAYFECECVDWNYLLDHIMVDSVSIPGPAAVSLKQALEYVVSFGAGHGFTLADDQEDGPSAVVRGFEWNEASMNKAFSDLTVWSGGWVRTVSPTKVIKFVQPNQATPTAPFAITGTSKRASAVEWEEALDKYATEITVVWGGTGTRSKTETFEVDANVIADGYYETELPSVPNTGVSATINGSPATIGPSGSSAQLVWHWATHRLTAGTYTPNLGDEISITYTAQYPGRTTVTGSGDVTIQLPPVIKDDIIDEATATAYANGLLAQHNQVVREFTIGVVDEGLEPGQILSIDLADRHAASMTAQITEVREVPGPGSYWRYTAKAIAGVYQGSPLDFWRGIAGGAGAAGAPVVNVTYTGGINPDVGEPITSLTTIAPLSGRIPYANGTDGFTSSSSLTFSGTTLSTGALNLTANATIGGDASITGSLGVTGAATLSSTLAVTGAATFAGNVGTASYASQTTGWRIGADGGADFRYLFADELHVRSFIADVEQALAGSQIITRSVAVVAEPFTVPAAGGSATLRVRDLPSAPNMAAFQSGDWVVLRAFSRAGGVLTVSEAVGQVSNYTDGSGPNEGTQTWTWTRGSGGSAGAMTAGTVIPADALALDYGVSGNGYHEVSAIDGAYGLNSPYAQTVTWTTAPVAANRTVQTRIGNLAGTHGYPSGTPVFGAVFGPATGTNITIDATNGIRIRLGTTNKLVADPSGNLNLVGDLVMGTGGVIRSGATAFNTGTGYWLAHNAGSPQFRIGNPSGDRLSWNGTNLTLVSSSVTIDTNAISIAQPQFSAGSLPDEGFQGAAGALYRFVTGATQVGAFYAWGRSDASFDAIGVSLKGRGSGRVTVDAIDATTTFRSVLREDVTSTLAECQMAVQQRTLGVWSSAASITLRSSGVIDVTGVVGIGTFSPTARLEVVEPTVGGGGGAWSGRFTNSSAQPFGVWIVYTGASPNNTGNYFWLCGDTTTNRAALLSNGGLANFSANNVNLSDERVKVIKGPARSQREAFRQLQLVEGRYQDSRRDVDDVMVTAQNVEQVYPELVETFPGTEDLKGVREHGLLMRALVVIQEQDAEIEAQREKIAALEARVAALE